MLYVLSHLKINKKKPLGVHKKRSFNPLSITYTSKRSFFVNTTPYTYLSCQCSQVKNKCNMWLEVKTQSPLCFVTSLGRMGWVTQKDIYHVIKTFDKWSRLIKQTFFDSFTLQLSFYIYMMFVPSFMFKAMSKSPFTNLQTP